MKKREQKKEKVSTKSKKLEDNIIPENKTNKKSKKKIIFFVILAIFLLASFTILGYFYFVNAHIVKNVVVQNKDFHEIEITWNSIKNVSNYAVVISKNKFTTEQVNENLKNEKTDSKYTIVEVKKNKVDYNRILSNTDYYVCVVAYKTSNKKKIYYKASDVVKIHTDSLKVDSITDLSVEDFSDTAVQLKWSLFETLSKNLDDTPIDIFYTLFEVENGEATEIQKDIDEGTALITDLKPFTKYSYKVVTHAIVDGKMVSSDDSNLLEVLTKPAPVLEVSSKSGGYDSISLSWSEYDKSTLDENAIVTYSVYGSDSENGEYTLLGENITELSFVEGGLPQSKTRFYYVLVTIEVENEKYVSNKSAITSSTTDRRPVSTSQGRPSSSGNSGGSSSSSSSGSPSTPSTGGLTAAEKNAQARVIARQIASSITGDTDLEKVSKAARAVSSYYYQGVHKESGDDYYTAYGVFIKGESSCAGTTRALGMVLEEMGYSWEHVNENLWTHQWARIVMDGQLGYADGQVGWAGYGKHPIE